MMLLYVEIRIGELSLEASPADGHPEYAGGRGRQTDPHEGLHSAPSGSHWAIPPAQHTSCQQASNVQEATETEKEKERLIMIKYHIEAYDLELYKCLGIIMHEINCRMEFYLHSDKSSL